MPDDAQLAVTICRECKARLNIVGGEVGRIVEHLSHGHAAAEVIENVIHSNDFSQQRSFCRLTP